MAKMEKIGMQIAEKISWICLRESNVLKAHLIRGKRQTSEVVTWLAKCLNLLAEDGEGNSMQDK